MSIHPTPDVEESLREDESWLTPEQARRVESIYLETTLQELEAECRLHRKAPFEEEFRYMIRTEQEKLNQITEDKG